MQTGAVDQPRVQVWRVHFRRARQAGHGGGEVAVAAAQVHGGFPGVIPSSHGGGYITYKRTFAVSSEVANNLGKFAVVQHGVDLDGNGANDFEAAGASELDPSPPQEATIPANCGVIDPTAPGPRR